MQSLALPTPNVPAEIARNVKLQPHDWGALMDSLARLAGNLVLAGLILLLTLWAAGRLSELARQGLGRVRRQHVDPTLVGLVGSMVRYGVVVVGSVAVLQQLGVQATSVVAVLGAASLAVGLALQGALSNVAAGVLILILRPYRTGDDVELTGKRGVVRSLNLFSTRLTNAEGVEVFVPNGKSFGEVVLNYSTMGRRRVELALPVDYEDDLAKGRDLLLAIARRHPKVLPAPVPSAQVTALSDTAVMLSLYAWTLPADWIQARAELTEEAIDAFDQAELGPVRPRKTPAETQSFARST